ncbi:MAG: hypothetical protein ACRD19_06360 [Terriglobia bacterium]
MPTRPRTLTIKDMYGDNRWKKALALPFPAVPELALLYFARFKLLRAFEAHLEDPASTPQSLQKFIARLHEITIALEEAGQGGDSEGGGGGGKPLLPEKPRRRDQTKDRAKQLGHCDELPL